MFFPDIGLVLLVWWLIVANLAAWLAAERGRRFWEWFAMGLLTGPLAILAVGLAPVVPSGRFTACDECQLAIPRRATKCPHCGTDLLEVLPDVGE